MSSLGVTRLYVLGDVSVFDAAIAQLVANDAPGAGITLVGLKQSIDTQTNSQPQGYAQIASDVAAERPDAVLLGASPGVGVDRAVARAAHRCCRTRSCSRRARSRRRRSWPRVAAPGGACTTLSRGERQLPLGGRRDLRDEPDPRAAPVPGRRARP